MKLSVQLVVLIALGLALVVTYSMPSDRQPIAVPGTGPISEPHPITLRACAKAVIARAVIEDGLSLTEAAALLGEVDRLLPDRIPPIVGIEDPSVDGPPTSEAERLCRQAIRWIKARDGARGGPGPNGGRASRVARRDRSVAGPGGSDPIARRSAEASSGRMEGGMPR